VTADDFQTTYGESISRTLDLSTWLPGDRLGDLYAQLEREVRSAAVQAERTRDVIREKFFPQLEAASGAPGGGLRQATVEQIERVHRGLLFTGQVEACDGTSVFHDALPLTVTQIGVCLVSYRGDLGSWAQRLYWRDLRCATRRPHGGGDGAAGAAGAARRWRGG
jgi:hypothetical protein